MIDPKALDAAFGKVLADVAALLKDGDVIAIDGKALRGARNKSENPFHHGPGPLADRKRPALAA